MKLLTNNWSITWLGLIPCILSSCVSDNDYRQASYRSDELQQMYIEALEGMGPKEIVEVDSEARASLAIEALVGLIEENLTVENADQFFDLKEDQLSQKRLLDILRGFSVSDINPKRKKYLLLSDQGLDDGLIKKFDLVLILKVIDLRKNTCPKNARKIRINSDGGIIDVAIVSTWEHPSK